MAKRKHRKDEDKKKFEHTEELIGIALIILSILSIVPKPFGFVGEITASFAMFLIGTGYQILLLAIFILGCYLVWKKEWPRFFNSRLVGIYCIVLGLIVLSHINYVTENEGDMMVVIKETVNNLMANFNRIAQGNLITLKGAGIIGALFSILFTKLFAVTGAYIVSVVIIFIGIFLTTGFSLIDKSKETIMKLKSSNSKEKEEAIEPEEETEEKADEKGKAKEKEDHMITSLAELNALYPKEEPEEAVLVNPEVVEENQENNTETPVQRTHHAYKLPSINILSPVKKSKKNNSEDVEKNIITLEKVLQDFGIIGKVVAVTEGPAVTQYELELHSGTKVNKLLGINREISLALAKKDVRIQAPIPGKSTVGIELPNEHISMVGMREIIENVPKSKENNKLLVALGKNIQGQPIFCEIDKTPHLLVAGSTGSGKSVLVDPKKVELSNYNGIPHLLMPVVTDPKKASVALQKLVSEMERRFDEFSEKGVKNIAGYNEWIDKQNETRGKDDQLKKMYYIVAIIDELADLMMVASKEVEDSIMRITQLARAAGIHLIVATQRPSTDVITGVVKSNLPSRISFAVSSGIDSRTILDQVGAEKLLGRGDMLFLPMGENSPTRVQGAYVSDEEIERLIQYTVNQQKAEYDEKFTNLTVNDGPSVDDVKEASEEYDDPLYNEIVEFVIQTKKASASALQRKYRLGYNRAARIIDLLEERGIIGPANGSKPREVLVGSNPDEEE